MTNKTQASVQQSFSGKTLLLTGATGFIGKAYLEKALRTCPDIGKVVVIVRNNPAKFANAQDRFQREVLSNPLFDTLKSRPEDWESRVEVLEASLTEPLLGLDEKTFQALGESVDLIVNCAASVNFREPLDTAVSINIRSVMHLAELSTRHDIPFLQVSTCYVHGKQSGLIKERLHRPLGNFPRTPDGRYDISGMLDYFGQRIAACASQRLSASERSTRLTDLGIEEANRLGWNDTYTMTKWMAEAYLHQKLKSQSLCVVRPAIVESALLAPAPGWIEGVKVADAVIMAYARGKTHVLPGRASSPIDVIPVDLVVNAMMLASAETITATPGTRTYQVGSSAVNPITVGTFRDQVESQSAAQWQTLDRLFDHKPSRGFTLLNRGVFHALMSVLSLAYRALAALPAGAGAGEKPAVPNRRQAQQIRFETTRSLATVFGFYMAADYRFDVSNLLALAERFSNSADFPVNPDQIDWEDYISQHLRGLNLYALRPREKPRPPLPLSKAKLA